jgi:hypothetical protein
MRFVYSTKLDLDPHLMFSSGPLPERTWILNNTGSGCKQKIVNYEVPHAEIVRLSPPKKLKALILNYYELQ